MSGKLVDVWITKYALTKGVIVAKADVLEREMIAVQSSVGPWFAYFHRNEWHQTKEAADARVREMAIRRIASLKKLLAAVEKIAAEGAKVTPW